MYDKWINTTAWGKLMKKKSGKKMKEVVKKMFGDELNDDTQ